MWWWYSAVSTKSKQARRSYWGLHVRFFKELCVAAKVTKTMADLSKD